MKRLLVILMLLGCTGMGIIHAQVPGTVPSSPLSMGGYVSYLGQYTEPERGDSALDQLVHQRFNLEYRWQHLNLSLTAGMRNRLFLGDSLDNPQFDELATADPGYWDLSWNWITEPDVLGNTTLDRLHVDWNKDDWLLRFGRQRIHWGMANTWNPNDLFNTYSIYDIDYEERPGTDALLISRNLGFASALDMTWALGESWDDTSLAARWLLNMRGYDFQLITGKNRADVVAGGGFRGSLLEAALRGEVTHFESYNETDGVNTPGGSTVASLEADYSIHHKRNIAWTVSGLFTSNPEDPENILLYLNRPLTARTLGFSGWTGLGSIGCDVTSLSRQNVSAGIYDDGSFFLSADNRISLTDNWDLLLVWQHYDGDPTSLFGTNPLDFLYARVRWNF